MKRFYLICTLILFPGIICASSADVTFSGHSVSTTFNDNGLCYFFSLKNNGDGISFSSPALFSYSNNSVFLGEIRPAGIFKYTLNKSSIPLSADNTKAFQKVSSPALNPSFTGVAGNFGSFDIAAFYPYGLFVDLHNKKAFAGAVLRYNTEVEVKKYQPDWNSMTLPGWNLSGLIGFNDSFKRGLFEMSVFEFARIGNNGETGFNVGLSVGSLKAEVYRRYSTITEDQPVHSIGYNLQSNGISFGMKFEQYAKAVFGGTVQKKSMEMGESFTYGHTCVKISNKTTGDVDAGRSSTSEFDLSYDGSEIDLSFDVAINRIADSPISVNKLNVKLECLNATFCIEGAKFKLTLSTHDYIKFGDSYTLVKYSIDQDRTISISAKLFF